MTTLENELYQALKYAKRFLKPEDVDMGFIDYIIGLAEQQLEAEQKQVD